MTITMRPIVFLAIAASFLSHTSLSGQRSWSMLSDNDQWWEVDSITPVDKSTGVFRQAVERINNYIWQLGYTSDFMRDYGLSCLQARENTLAALTTNRYYWADPVSGRSLGGEYFQEGRVIFRRSYQQYGAANLASAIIHEAQHHAGHNMEQPVREVAGSCLTNRRRERDKEGENDGSSGRRGSDGRSGNGSGGSTGPTITSKVPYGIPGVWIIIFFPRASVGPITVICDYDSGTGWSDCPDMSK